MSYILTINTLPQQHFKDMKRKDNTNDKGVVFNRMESGRANYFIRWSDVLYDLTLQVLTKDEVVAIRKEITNSMLSDSLITLDYEKMLAAGWFDFEETGGTDPDFYVTPPMSINRIAGTDLWNIKLKLSHRISAVT